MPGNKLALNQQEPVTTITTTVGLGAVTFPLGSDGVERSLVIDDGNVRFQFRFSGDAWDEFSHAVAEADAP